MRCAARCVFEGPAALSAVRGVQGPVSSSHIRASARQVRTEDPARGVPRRVLSAALRPPHLGVLLHRARRRLHLGSEARRAVPDRTAAFIAHIPAVRARKCALGACPCIARSRALLLQLPVVRRGAWGVGRGSRACETRPLPCGDCEGRGSHVIRLGPHGLLYEYGAARLSDDISAVPVHSKSHGAVRSAEP